MKEKSRLAVIVGKTLKIIRTVFLALLGIVFVLALLIYLFEDKIKQYAVSYLNQYLTTEVRVESIDLSLFSKFPNASLDFTNVIIMDPPTVNKKKDTLLFAEKIYLEFSIWDLLANDYSVKNVEFNKADLRVYIDEKGNENYVIWKKSESKEDSKFNFELKKLALYDSRIRYTDRRSRQDYSLNADELFLKGEFSERVYALHAGMNGHINHFKSRDLKLISDKSTSLDLQLNVNRDTRLIEFNTGLFRLGDMNFGVSGSVSDQKQSVCDVHISGQDIRIESLLKTFPSVLGDDLQYYETSGDLKFVADITGDLNEPFVSSTFNIQGARLNEKRSGVTLSELNFIGSFTGKKEGQSDQLLIDDLSGRFKDGTFKGKISLTGLEEPLLRAQLHGDFNMATLYDFFRFKEVEKTSGYLHLSANVTGKFTHIPEEETWSMDVQKASGNALISDLTMKLREHPVTYSDFSGKFTLSNNNAVVEGLKGHLGKSDIAIDGVLQNLVPYLLLKKQKLNVVADFQSELIDLDDLLATEKVPQEQAATESHLSFPDDINFNLDASVQKIRYSTFHANSIRGNFKLIDQVFKGSNLSLVFAKGLCTGDLEVDGRSENEFAVTSNVNISDMDIRETFVLFKNFGQDVVKEDNIKGLLSAKVSFGTVIDPSLKIDQNKIVSIVALSLKNGELIGLQSFKDIADYMRSDKKIRLALGKSIDDLESRLKHIRFSELTNTLEIRNGNVHIPDMDIQSTALTAHLWGDHSFENIIDYHINFRFLELKAQNNETEYGTIIDDKTGFKIYIHMFGDLKNPKFESDSKERKQDRKEYNEAEKQNIKAILKEEFGLFKNDTTLKMKETPEESVKFLLEWDQNQEQKDPAKTDEKKKEEKKKDNKDRMDKFKKKLGVEEEEKTKMIVE